MQFLLQDLRFAARTLRKDLGFAVIAVAVLAIGIGVTSAIFSLVDAALLRPLAYRDPDRLLLVWEKPPGYVRNTVAPGNYNDWRQQNQTFEAVTAVGGWNTTLTGAGEAEQLREQLVDASFFTVLGVQPMLGRAFTVEEEKPGTNVTVLSHELWARRFGANAGIVGSSIALDGEATTVLGVMPPNFQFLNRADLWQPLQMPKLATNRKAHILKVAGRLKPGVSVDQARADLSGIAAHIAEISPDTNRGWGVTLDPLHQAIVGDDLRRTSWVLLGAVGFVLLIACANVANTIKTVCCSPRACASLCGGA